MSDAAPAQPSDALALVRELFSQLRLRGFDLGPQDLYALRSALAAGFGWGSSEALAKLLVALWSKTPREAAALRALFARLPWPAWWEEGAMAAAQATAMHAPPPGAEPGVMPLPHGTNVPARDPPGFLDTAKTGIAAAPEPQLAALGGLPPLPRDGVGFSDARLIDVEMYPLNHREVAQAFRRLRRPARFGAAVELDIEATVQLRTRQGLATPPVLVPRRRNTAQLAVFVDTGGSMQPYAPFIDLVCDAIAQAGLLKRTQCLYFHDAPGDPPDSSLLDDLPTDGFSPVLDGVLPRIEAHAAGEVYRDATLEEPIGLAALLHDWAPGTTALLLTDAGAARGKLDLPRLHHWLAFARALRQRGAAVAALNPVPRPLWARTGAQQFARHVPMFELDRAGILRAVNALRGQPVALECAL